MSENVNHPSHYNQGKIEVIEFIEDKTLGFHLGNAVKYISRAGKKDPAKRIEDLRKAIWYTERQIALWQAEEPNVELKRPNDMNAKVHTAADIQAASQAKNNDKYKIFKLAACFRTILANAPLVMANTASSPRKQGREEVIAEIEYQIHSWGVREIIDAALGPSAEPKP